MTPIRVFISYSRDDEIWLAEWLDPVLQTVNPRCLLRQWQRTFRNDNVEFWFDREQDKGLRGGDPWRDRIFEEIDRSDVAVLLVTQQFVISPVIMDEELPRILARHKKGEMEVLPLLVQPTRLKGFPTGDSLQWAPGKPNPLSAYFEHGENAFAEARNEVLDALEAVIQRAKARKGRVARPSVGTEHPAVLSGSKRPVPESRVPPGAGSSPLSMRPAALKPSDLPSDLADFTREVLRRMGYAARVEVSYADDAYVVRIDAGSGNEILIGKNGEILEALQHVLAIVGAKMSGHRENVLLRVRVDVAENPEIGRIYRGRVRRIVNFGAFVEITPGQDGLVHISELEDHRVARVEDVVKVDDIVFVKVMGVDEEGKIRLSRRGVPQEGAEAE
jgi:hypothetical protein